MNKPSPYIQSLDGVRFLAVTLVLIAHWIGDEKVGFYPSYLGVCMFFVLSGFLISGILLKAKESDESASQNHWFSLKQFYIRRTLRIFPLYYFIIAILWLFDVSTTRENVGWLLTYMTNNYMAFHQHWMGSYDHLWSLAVEEQFYLFFPFIIFFIPKKWLVPVIFSFLPLAILLRFYFYLAGYEWITPYVWMPTSLDAFGLGALLAMARRYDWGLHRFLAKFSTLLASLFFLGLITYLSKNEIESHNFYSIVPLRFFEALFSLSLIAFVSKPVEDGFSKRFISFFEIPAFVFIGKVSYGIYVYHQFIYNEYYFPEVHPLQIVFNGIDQISPALLQNTAFKFGLLYALTLLVATLSWYAFEKPINQLKDKFSYRS
jgi:peptidoglycan/LPS O-acetylase OafA/YrhL